MNYKLIGESFGFKTPMEIIMQNRGITDIEAFLNVGPWNLESPKLYDNISLGANMLLGHLKKNNNICIVVDCDADGYTSGALIFQYIKLLLKHLNIDDVNIDYILHEGKAHGLDPVTLNTILSKDYKLVILPDAGTNDFSQHEQLRSKDIDVLILDHHNSDQYSENAIIINNQLSVNVNNKALTGVGVVYKFCKVIDETLGIDFADSFLDLVALGSIADLADLRELETRYLVLEGIKSINQKSSKNKLIESLVNHLSYSLGGEVSIIGIAFYVAPVINAVIRAGTLEEKTLLFRAFTNDDEFLEEHNCNLIQYVTKMCSSIKRRQDNYVKKSVPILNEQIEHYGLNKNEVIVVNSTGILDGNFTGLVANKIANNYEKPCLVLRKVVKENTINGPKKESVEYLGSARGYSKSESISNLQLWCQNTGLFNFASGHDNAFGVGIGVENLEKLFKYLNDKKDSAYVNTERVDLIFNDKTFTKTTVGSLGRLKGIWGTTVFEPKYVIENITIPCESIAIIGKNKNTLKFSYKGVDFIKFFVREEFLDQLTYGKDNKYIEVTVLGRFSINSFNGIETEQVVIDKIISRKKEVFSF